MIAIARAGWLTMAPAQPVLPSSLTDVDGQMLDLAGLARDYQLVGVTILGAWCEICRTELRQLAKLQKKLEACKARFFVMGPDSPQELRQLRRATGFQVPFVADQEFEVVGKLGLVRGWGEMEPVIFMTNRQRQITWFHSRYEGDLGYERLKQRIKCNKMIAQAVDALRRVSPKSAVR